MNLNKISYEKFTKIYQYLVYKKQNIGKLIQNNEDYNSYMKQLQKNFPEIEDIDDKLYYHNLITEMEKEFNIKKNKTIYSLEKINLIIDIFETYDKICNYEKKIKQLKTTVKNGFHLKIKQEIEMIQKIKIGNPLKQNMLIPISIICDKEKKEEYLKNNYLNHRLIEKLKYLLGLSSIECQVLITNKRDIFFKNFKKKFYSKSNLISKKTMLEDELAIFNKIDKFLTLYNKNSYFCPFCHFNSNREFDVCFHYHTQHNDLLDICPVIYNGINKININNTYKCPYCPKTFTKEDEYNILYHIKINHLFEVENVRNISKHIIKDVPRKKISVKKITKKKFEIDPEIYYGIVDKIEHEYNKLFRKPNPCLVKSLIKDEIDDMLDEEIPGNKLHMSIDTAIEYSEQVLYGKLFKFIRKSLGKELFNKIGLQKNFGYQEDFMTTEIEFQRLLMFIKDELTDVIINNIYGHVSSNYTMITKEFTDNFDTLINSFSRHEEVFKQIQNILNHNNEKQMKTLDEKFEKVYDILNGDITSMKECLTFLFKFMKKVSKIPDMKHPDIITSLVEDMIIPDKKVNIKTEDNYDETKEEIDLKFFFLLFSYLDKSETKYIVDGIFDNIIKTELNSRMVEKPYVWTWKYGNFVEDELEQDFNLQLQSIKEFKDCFLNVFTKFNKNITENIEENVTDFDYLVLNINEIEDIEGIYKTYNKIQEILRFFNDINTNSIVNVKGEQFETINTFTRHRLKYFNNDGELINASSSEVDKYNTRLLQMRKRILNQKIHLISIIVLLHKFLVKILDDEYMSNGNEQKSFSLFFKRYFQLISLIMSKRTEKNKLPRFDNIFNKRTTKTVEVETYEKKVSEDIYDCGLEDNSLLSDDSEVEFNECLIEQDLDDEENIHEDYHQYDEAYEDVQEFDIDENFE